MSLTFNTIRRMVSSSRVDENDVHVPRPQTVHNNKSKSTSSSNLTLAHTLGMSCQKDDAIQFKDSLSLSQSLQITKRAHFHKYDDGIRRTTRVSKTKSILDSLSTSLRTDCDVNHPLENIVETVSIALVDVYHESYGSPTPAHNDNDEGMLCSNTKPKIGIDVKEMKNLVYKCTNLSFKPQTCAWTGMVCYSCDIEMKANEPGPKVRTIPCSGNFMFQATCQSVQVEVGTGLNHHDQINGSDITMQDQEWSRMMMKEGKNHLCIDIEAILNDCDNEDDIRAKYDRNMLIVMSHTLTHIGYDVSRALLWLDLPDFPQGCKDVKFRTIYQLNKKIKSGAFATVCLSTRRETGEQVAVKCIQRKKLTPFDDVSILREVSILASLSQQYICPIHDFFMEDECYFIVMDLMEGGDVFDRVGELEYYDESIARELCRKMLSAIAFCHEQNVAHCDLKPKNLLLKKRNDDSSVMLADFGFATRVFAPKTLTKQCGTPYFIAPEILLRRSYDQQADMWSVGVIIFCLLSGQLPFTGKRHLEIFKAIIAGDFTFGKEWGSVSDHAKDLISKLLVTDPDKRYTAKDALASHWIRVSSDLLRRHSLISSSSRLKTFNAKLKFKSAILAIQTSVRWKNITKKRKIELSKVEIK